MESPDKPDFAKGVPVDHLPDGGMMQGQVSGEDVLLTRRGGKFLRTPLSRVEGRFSKTFSKEMR